MFCACFVTVSLHHFKHRYVNFFHNRENGRLNLEPDSNLIHIGDNNGNISFIEDTNTLRTFIYSVVFSIILIKVI